MTPGPMLRLGRTGRKGRRVERSLWVSREGGGEGNGGDIVLRVEGKGKGATVYGCAVQCSEVH